MRAIAFGFQLGLYQLALVKPFQRFGVYVSGHVKSMQDG